MDKSLGDQAVEKVEGNRSDIGLSDKTGGRVEQVRHETTERIETTQPSQSDAARESAEQASDSHQTV